jgi:hypothetical protein
MFDSLKCYTISIPRRNVCHLMFSLSQSRSDEQRLGHQSTRPTDSHPVATHALPVRHDGLADSARPLGSGGHESACRQTGRRSAATGGRGDQRQNGEFHGERESRVVIQVDEFYLNLEYFYYVYLYFSLNIMTEDRPTPLFSTSEEELHFSNEVICDDGDEDVLDVVADSVLLHVEMTPDEMTLTRTERATSTGRPSGRGAIS